MCKRQSEQKRAFYKIGYIFFVYYMYTNRYTRVEIAFLVQKNVKIILY